MEFQLKLVIIACTLLSVVKALSNSGNQTNCYNDERSHRSHYASKTAYEVMRPHFGNRELSHRGCKPQKIWLLSRHGTRLPGKKDIRVMSSELSGLRDSILENIELSKVDSHTICPSYLKRLETWQWNSSITLDRESYLTEQGWNDLKSLAKRMKKRFPKIFSKRYSQANYLFRHTNTQRTEASFKAFIEGLFGPDADGSIKAECEPNEDTLLKPYDSCPAYQHNENRIKKTDSELNRFLRSRVYLQTVSDISTQLGFASNLSSSQIEAMWDACRYEQAWQPRQSSPWCGVFNRRQVEVLEYKEDLKYYYQNSYGYAKSADLACFTVADMIRNFEPKNDPRVVAYFTHESEIQIFLTALGALKDRTPLKANNFRSMGKRQFKSSIWTPFAANVIAVKYDCREHGDSSVKIGFFLNEQPLRLDWCRGRLCSWHKVVQRYKRSINGDCSVLYCR
ncbi:multiple inositol polyphosphate phosphatase 1-like [Sabethes cyaneus]|uniref:multiple inositol polyphosphate phosphatase 1-like n=1 Tax=Sabethes cyaneus TaxID=53552 RepID=UPI00237D6131|nr:multiple inositol polyphosphate phosphatase 1-like [Sabethes cyaneus]